MSFGTRLKELRGTTPVVELAERAGLSRQSIYRYESGRSPSWETVCALADALDVTPDAFLPSGESPEKSKKSSK